MDPPGSQALGWAKWCAWSRLGVDGYGLYVRKGEPVFLFNLGAVNACAEQARKRSRRASTT
jgi:hypothetical protein